MHYFLSQEQKMLHISSLLFVTNCLHAAALSHYYFLFLFSVLTITSFVWHARIFESEIFWWIDHVAVYTTVLSCIYYSSVMHSGLRFACLGIAVVIAIIYYRLERNCSLDLANEMHVVMHALAVIALHMILIGTSPAIATIERVSLII